MKLATQVKIQICINNPNLWDSKNYQIIKNCRERTETQKKLCFNFNFIAFVAFLDLLLNAN